MTRLYIYPYIFDIFVYLYRVYVIFRIMSFFYRIFNYFFCVVFNFSRFENFLILEGEFFNYIFSILKLKSYCKKMKKIVWQLFIIRIQLQINQRIFLAFKLRINMECSSWENMDNKKLAKENTKKHLKLSEPIARPLLI